MPTPAEDAKPAQPAPSLYLNEKDLDNFGLHDCVPGEKYTATIDFTVTGMDAPSNGEASKRIEIDKMSDIQPHQGAGDVAAPETMEEGLPIDAEPVPDEAEPTEEPDGEEDAGDMSKPYIRRKAKKPSQFPVDVKKLQRL